MTFQLDSTLAEISAPVKNMGVCELRLMHDARYTWCMLIPQVDGCVEFHDLEPEQMASVGKEIRSVSKALAEFASADKINVAMFGHGVTQCHIHIAARHFDDALWPKTCFMTGPAEPRSAEETARLATDLAALLEELTAGAPT